jgi:hypothetical protein
MNLRLHANLLYDEEGFAFKKARPLVGKLEIWW